MTVRKYTTCPYLEAYNNCTRFWKCFGLTKYVIVFFFQRHIVDVKRKVYHITIRESSYVIFVGGEGKNVHSLHQKINFGILKGI